MDAAWFGLLGVVVGAFISAVAAWLLIVRQEQTEAMVAARLVDDELAALTDDGAATNDVSPAPDLWLEHRVALAKVLGEQRWRTIAEVYRRADQAPVDAALVLRARDGLRPLVQGRRHIIPERWMAMLRARDERPAVRPPAG